jgi:hypothetical protein
MEALLLPLTHSRQYVLLCRLPQYLDEARERQVGHSRNSLGYHGGEHL